MPGVVPCDEHALALFGGQDRKLRQSLTRILQDSLEQGRVVADESLDRRGIEQIGRVLQLPPQRAAGDLAQDDREIEA